MWIIEIGATGIIYRTLMALDTPLRVETDLGSETAARLGFVLAKMNAGLTPASPDYWTAADLIAGLLDSILEVVPDENSHLLIN